MKSVAISRSFSNILSRDLSITKRPLLMLNQNSNRIKGEKSEKTTLYSGNIVGCFTWIDFLV